MESKQRNFMTDEEKGYHCPMDGTAADDFLCRKDCPYYHTKCIAFGSEGKRKAEEWEKKTANDMKSVKRHFCFIVIQA